MKAKLAEIPKVWGQVIAQKQWCVLVFYFEAAVKRYLRMMIRNVRGFWPKAAQKRQADC